MSAPRTVGKYSTGRSNADIVNRNRVYYDRLRIANREAYIRNREEPIDYDDIIKRALGKRR
jgi:hypothetical protein